MPEKKPQAERLIEAYAHELAADLIRTGGNPRRARFETEGCGWRVTVEVCPASELPDGLTECERDIVGVLRGRPFRMTTTMILSELGRLAAQGKLDLYGDSTVKHGLARLAKAGIVSSSRAAPRGYAICERYREASADAG
jgi:hypothetical protein